MEECKPDPKGALICGFGGTFVWWLACKALNVYEDGDFIWKQINFFYSTVIKFSIYGLGLAVVLVPVFYLLKDYVDEKFSKTYRDLEQEYTNIHRKIKFNEENYLEDRERFQKQMTELIHLSELITAKDKPNLTSKPSPLDLNAQNFI